MSRPQLIEWLESETGQRIERPEASAPKSRHVSIRVPEEGIDAAITSLLVARDRLGQS